MNDPYDPHPSVAQLTAFDTGQLADLERATIEQHVDRCTDCCRMLDALPEDPLAALLHAFAGGPGTEAVPTSRYRGTDTEVPAALAGHPRYRVLEVLGAGGMGVVYKAVHRLMDRVVALKVIHRRLTERPAFVERFRREVQAAARLAHPHIVTAYDAEQAGDTHFLVMEYVAGSSLDRELARRGPLPVKWACDLIRQAALGLQHAHERGLVHCDIKPANLLLTPGGQIKILDFGLAQLVGNESARAAPLPAATVMGTPDYLAPEQARDPQRADIRADIYSLGCTLYHLLSGDPPFLMGTPLQKLLAHQERLPRPITAVRADVPEALGAILERMLAKDPADRYPTPAAVAAALAPLTGEPAVAASAGATPRSRRTHHGLLLLGLAAVVATAAVLTVHVAWPSPPLPSPPTEKTVTSSERSSKPAPATAIEVRTLQQGPLTKAELRRQAVAWLQANSAWGPDHEFVQRTEGTLDEVLSTSAGCQFVFGPRLLKSHRPTILAVYPGGLFLAELSDEVAQEWKVNPGSYISKPYRRGPELRPDKARAALSALTVAQSNPLDGTRPVTVAVTYRMLEAGRREHVLRLTFHASKFRRSVLFYPREQLSADEGVLTFQFPALATVEEHLQEPLMLFVELASREDGKLVIESNAVAALVRVRAGE